jgi:hypothetical protein
LSINQSSFNSTGNSSLTCISVDDWVWSAANWFNVDVQHYFNNNCNGLITWDCVNNTCVNPGTGSGAYNSLCACESACIIMPSWNCIGGACIDPGTGLGSFTDSLQCVSSCITPPNPTWNCTGGACIDPGTGLGSFTDSLQCVINCTSTDLSNLKDLNTVKLIKIIDVLGRETPYKKRTPLFYIYDDGTVEKRIVIE